MKYLKTYENTNKPEIGDYAIFTGVSSPEDVYAEQYGIIVNLGRSFSKRYDLYLIEIMSDVNTQFSKILKQNYNNGIVAKYDIPIKKDTYYAWTCIDYIYVYKNKREFDKALEIMKLSKISSKYNI